MKTTKNNLINKAAEMGLSVSEEMTKAVIMEAINAATEANAINNGEANSNENNAGDCRKSLTIEDVELISDEIVYHEYNTGATTASNNEAGNNDEIITNTGATTASEDPVDSIMNAIAEIIIDNGEKIKALAEKLEEINANDNEKIKATKAKIASIRKDSRELAVFSKLVSLGTVDGTTTFFKETADNLKLGQYRGLGRVAYYLDKITLAKPETKQAAEAIKDTTQATRDIIDGLNLTLTSKIEVERNGGKVEDTTIYNLIDTDFIPQRVGNDDKECYKAINTVIKPWVERNGAIFSTDYKMLWFVSDTKDIVNASIASTANSNKRETYMKSIENFIDKFQGIIQAKIKGLEAKRGKKADIISTSTTRMINNNETM